MLYLGPVLFYQAAFENQRFEFGVNDDPLHVNDSRDQALRFGRVGRAFLEIGADPVAQIDSLADVEDRPVLVLVQVAARIRGQVFQLQRKGRGGGRRVHDRLILSSGHARMLLSARAGVNRWSRVSRGSPFSVTRSSSGIASSRSNETSFVPPQQRTKRFKKILVKTGAGHAAPRPLGGRCRAAARA
jgi:hypothetical protein